ncbi:MAG: sulfatase-like hydrolase/transferase [Planctomycetaceae bacterium]|nr:sulfatase-like hydrolase/transferase [Planctomycetaceae bacterium]
MLTAKAFTWPGGGTTMFRGEKNTQWEGGFRVPNVIRWTGVIKPGRIVNSIRRHEEMLPTLLAAASDSTVKEDLLKCKTAGGRNYKVHLDGYSLLPVLQGRQDQWPREEFLSRTDNGHVAALRYKNWIVTFEAKRT